MKLLLRCRVHDCTIGWPIHPDARHAPGHASRCTYHCTVSAMPSLASCWIRLPTARNEHRHADDALPLPQVAHNIAQGEWVAQLPFFPGLQDAEALDYDACERGIAACLGGKSAVPFKIKSIGSWAMSAKVLERLSLGRVHILGDAAHQFPPAGAFGANTGLQDAHNLCWKIASVCHGSACDRLVRSYDAERRPVALANARLSVHNYHRGLRVARALGLPSELPHQVASLMHSMYGLVSAPCVQATCPNALCIASETLVGTKVADLVNWFSLHAVVLRSSRNKGLVR